jgi:hypothetical protein
MDEMSKRKRIEWGVGRAAFLAHSAEILAQLARGRPRSCVWREFQERLGGLSNSQFNRYARVLISNAEKNTQLQQPTASPTSLSLRFSLGWPSTDGRWTWLSVRQPQHEHEYRKGGSDRVGESGAGNN